MSALKIIPTVTSSSNEILLRDLRLRLRKVNENNPADPNDDSVEVTVRTATTSQDLTIVVGHSANVEDFEIFVIDVRPSATPGLGTAKIQVNYFPASGSK